MTVSNCGHDENGRYSGGKAGDQTGKEWWLINWYNFSQNVVLVHPNDAVNEMVADMSEAAARNDHNGYDQGQRVTYWAALEAANYHPENITQDNESDCSSGVAANVKGAGFRLGDAKLQAVSKDCYTGNLRAALVAAGYVAFYASKYLTSDAYLPRGAICLNETRHVNVQVTNGARSVKGSAMCAGGGQAESASASLGSWPRKGWTGEEVKKLQRALIAKGYSCGSSGVDGSFGPDTEAAVRKYQQDNGLEVDGIVGPMTQASLYGTCTTQTAPYTVGTYITCVGGLRVRTGAGTGYSIKSKSQLTTDGQKHSDDAGQLYSGTTVTVSEVKQVGAEWWGKIPSGWICLFQNKPFATKKL